MTRAWALLLLLGLQAPVWGDDLSEFLDRMEKAQGGLRTLQAQVTVLQKATDQAKEATPYTRGKLIFRSPGAFAWSGIDVRSPGKNEPGIRATLGETGFLLFAPWGSTTDPDSRTPLGRERHGAEWFRGALVGESPPLSSALIDHPSYVPMVLVFDLAPRRFLSTLPKLRMGEVKTENGRSFQVLDFVGEGAGEVWVDVADARIDRLRVRFRDHEWRFRVLSRTDGIATTIEAEQEGDRSAWIRRQRMELTDVVRDAPIGDDELLLPVPEGRFVRDWMPRPETVYRDRVALDPKDAGAWLEIAALLMERGDWAPAEEAFRTVAALRPGAPEGYLGLLGALAMNRDKSAGTEVLEKASPLGWPLFHREAAERYLRRGDVPSARRHFEAILAIQPDDIPTMLEMARTTSRNADERKALMLQALKLDLDRGSGAEAHGIWTQNLLASEEVADLHRKALEADPSRPWIHRGLMEHYEMQGWTSEAGTCALAILRLLEEGKPVLGRHDTLQLFKSFVAAGDLDSARRLQRAMAAHADPHASAWALELGGELVAREKGVADLVAHIDRAFVPPATDRFKRPHPALTPFLEGLKREKKLEAVAAALLETPPDSERGRFHTAVLAKIAEEMRGSDRQKLLVRVQERQTGRPPELAMLLLIVQSLAQEKKWPELRTRATELLARPDLSKDGRGIAESALAECHEAAGDFQEAVLACDRALAACPPRSPWIRRIRGHALAGLGDAARTAENVALGFDEAWRPLEEEGRGFAERMLFEDLRGLLVVRKDLSRAMEGAAGQDPKRVGFNVILAVVEEQRGNPRGAVDAFERAVATRPTGTILRELFMDCLWAGRLDRAIELRGRLAAVVFAKPPTGRVEEPFDIDVLNKKLLGACQKNGDPECCKRFARALAAEPLGRFSQEWLIRDLFLSIVDDRFFQEIDESLVRNATSEGQRFNAHVPLAWAYGDLGLGEEAAAVYERALEEGIWSEDSRRLGLEWIGEFRKRKSGFSLELVRSWLPGPAPGADETESLRSALGGYGPEHPPLDRMWRFHLRREHADPIWLKLGALRGRTLEERLDCLVELSRRGEARREWRLLLALTRVERGEEDLAAPILVGLLKETPEADRPDFIKRVEDLSGRGLPRSRDWSRLLVAEARLEMAEGAEERIAAAMDLAAIHLVHEDPLLALLTLGRVGEAPVPERFTELKLRIRRTLPEDLFPVLKDLRLPPLSGPQAAVVETCIRDLGSDDFETRTAAHRALVRIGAPAVPSLLPLLDAGDIDLRSHVREILIRLLGD